MFRSFVLLCLCLSALSAQAAHGHESASAPSPVRFVLNKGQWEPQIQLAADLCQGGRVFLEEGKLTFAFCDTRDLHERWFHRLPDAPPIVLDCHSYSISFVGANPDARIVPQEKTTDHHNYFVGQDSSKWASDVPLFKSVRYENIYPGIDYVLHGGGSSLKYDFIVRPGGDPSQIRMRFEGQDGLKIDAQGLSILTSVIEVQDSSPVAFQGGHPLACEFRREGNEIGFQFPEGYDPRQALWIDPTMVFSTYTGSAADNFGFTATYDDFGNLYAGGIAYGTGYPVTSGSYQSNFAGGSFDVSISKFSTTGSHMYSTYIGGNGSDQPHSMIADPNGNLLVMGRTFSSNFPVTGSAYDPSYNGGADIFVCRLSISGSQLQASTYMGGSGDDALNTTSSYTQQGLKYNYGDDARGEIVVDAQGNVYVANCTRSSNFPVSSSALSTSLSGSQDGCVFKLNPNLNTLVWSSYLGGSGDDAAYSLKVDGSGNVFVTGGTSSGNFPTTSGTISPGYNGAIDGFVVHFNNNGSGLLAGTYIGTSGYNQCYFIELDADEDVYVVGQKTGAFPVTPGVWSMPQGGQFIQKIDNDLGSVIYSTQFGTSNSTINISPTAFLVDICEYVYVSGWGGNTNFEGSTSGLPVTPGTFQANTDGSDVYIIVLQKDAVALDFSTFVGGSVSREHVDGGTSRFNKNAEIYQSVCAGCWGNSDFPTTANAWSNNNNSNGCNLACFKMELPIPGIRAEFTPTPNHSGCAPLTVNFTNQSIGGVSFDWNFADPSSGALNTSTLYSPTHTFNQAGVYQVMLVAMDPNSCNVRDTSYEIIQVFNPPNASVTPDTSVCTGQSVVLTASGGQTYSWSPPTGLSTVNGPSTTATPPGNITYTVVVGTQGNCRDTVTVNVDLLPSPVAAASGDVFICPGDSTQLNASGGQTYAWSNAGSLSAPNVPDPWASPSQTTNYVVTVTAANGCTDRDTVQVSVSTVQAQAGPNVDLCIGASTQLNGSGGGSYLWSPPASLSGTSIPNPVANPTSTMTYYLEVTDIHGCTSIDSVRITLHDLPIVSAGPDLILCEQDSVQLTASGANQYQWSPPTGLNNPNIGNPYAYPTSQITYYLVGTDQWGCQNRDTLEISVLPAPQAVATAPSVICEDSTAQLFATGGMSYEWSPAHLLNDPNIQNPIATLAATTDIVVRVVGANGCDDRDTVRISVTPTPYIEALGDRLLCLGHGGVVFAVGGESVLWSTGDTIRRLPVYPDTTTYYSVTTWVDDCPSPPDSVLVVVDTDLPTADFYASPDSGILPLTSNFFNQSTGSVAWDWNFGDGHGVQGFGASHTYQDTGRFVVRLISYDENGCADTVYKRVIVGVDFTIHVPNAFTPNGDGINDYFNTPWIGVKEFHMMIFDRWGMLIYESFDPNFRWYGIFKGDGCQEGVYTYVLEARGQLGPKVKRAGTVTLYR